MRKLILLLILLLTPILAKADELTVINSLKSLPGIKQGIAFDVSEAKFNYLSTLGILKYGSLGLDAGYSSDDKLVATLSYDIGGLNKIGIDTPITNLIDLRVGMYAGYGRLTGSNEFSWGPEVTVVQIKF
jgi:hypothetical protein